jgi:hypothetical protein
MTYPIVQMATFISSCAFCLALSALAGCAGTLEGEGVATSALAKASHKAPGSARLSGWSIIAFKPSFVDGEVEGSFAFERDSGADKRAGGACVLADIYRSGHECASYLDCDAAYGRPAGGFNYCIDVTGSGKKRCWARPTANGCIRSRDDSADGLLGPGTYVLPRVPAVVNGEVPQWITYGCLADDGHPTACGSPEIDPAKRHDVHALSPVLRD